jgi:hypothetical protein
MAVVHSIFIYFIPLFTFTRIWNPKWDGANSTLVSGCFFFYMLSLKLIL